MSEKSTFYHYTSVELQDLKVPKSQIMANSIYTSLTPSKFSSTMLSGLSKISLFVGPNNSGKSRLLRTIFFNNNYRCEISDFDFSLLQNAINSFEADILKEIRSYGTIRTEYNSNVFNVFRPHGKILDILNTKIIQRGDFSFFKGTCEDLQAFERSTRDTLERIMASYSRMDLLLPKVVQRLRDLANELQKIEKTQPSFVSCPQSQIYIPILRTLRSTESEVRFGRTTMLDYFQLRDEPINSIGPERTIFDGTQIHKEMVDLLLMSSFGRQKVLEYEKFLSTEFFEGKPIQLSPNHYDKTIYITIGDLELPAYSLGDGMQSILMLTFPAFFATESKLIFAEEPELYLHPGMQRRIIEVILSNANLKRHQWFFTTHSNHFIDMTLDYSQISVFHCEKNNVEDFKVTKMTSPDLNLLSRLGVMASSVFRTNATIWVEGITDRRYLRAFIAKHLKDANFDNIIREDLHFSFVELGGGNMIHFDFFGKQRDAINVKRIAGNSFIIIDGDNSKGSRIKDIEENVPATNRFILDQKEIENILPEPIVKACVITLINDSDLKNKTEILQKIDLIKYSEYCKPATKFGAYLDTKLRIAESGNEGGYFSAKSGTIKQKIKFCDIAINAMNSGQINWTISDAAKPSIEKICHFICEHNKPLNNTTSN